MLFSLLIWALKVALATVVLLLIAILFAFLWTVIITNLLHGPSLSFFDVALLTAIVSVGVGTFTFSLPRRPNPPENAA